MRLSISLHLDVLRATAGSILNTFKIHPRRDVLFFEDILAQYIKECEKAGYGKEMGEIGKKWCTLETSLIPDYMHKLAPEYVPNVVIKNVWVNLGLVDDFKVSLTGNLYVIKTKDEFITRVIGENNFMCGLFIGALAGFHRRDAVCKGYSQKKGACRYVLELLDVPFILGTKPIEKYRHLNTVPNEDGLSLKKAIQSGFFQLSAGNRITFRGKTMLCFENSGFHLLGRKAILLERLSDITTSFFERIVKKDSTPNDKLVLLKNIVQSCGWGRTAVISEDGTIKFFIECPPYGMQAEPDNWDFLAYFILGYLHLINKKIKLDRISLRGGKLLLSYSGK